LSFDLIHRSGELNFVILPRRYFNFLERNNFYPVRVIFFFFWFEVLDIPRLRLADSRGPSSLPPYLLIPPSSTIRPSPPPDLPPHLPLPSLPPPFVPPTPLPLPPTYPFIPSPHLTLHLSLSLLLTLFPAPPPTLHPPPPQFSSPLLYTPSPLPLPPPLLLHRNPPLTRPPRPLLPRSSFFIERF